jgi:16S rRNA (cytidine1402-2'-O)-methyltransferase
LNKYEIKTPTISYHQKSTQAKLNEISLLVKEGKTISLVTDAGTPGISDPGTELIAFLRENFSELLIVSVPGASALVSAIATSGLRTSEFTFLGFLPHKKGRQKIFNEIEQSNRTIIFYESPHRLMKTLSSLKEINLESRKVCVQREHTKLFESTVVGVADEVFNHFEKNPDQVRGEVVVIVEGSK